MSQTWEKGKKSSFRPKFGPKFFFCGFYLYCMLDIVASYHCMQLQGKLTNQIWENDEKPSFRNNSEPFRPDLSPNIFHEFNLYYMLEIVQSYYSFAVSRKTNEPISTMVKNLVSGSILAPLDQIWAKKIISLIILLLPVSHCCKLSLYAVSRKTNEPNLRK